MANFDETKKILKTKLLDFLEQSGVKPAKKNKNGNFYLCINPNHDDHDPSMHLTTFEDGTQMAHCFGCGTTVDIFTANHMLNGVPVIGHEFITENMKPLADKYGVDLKLRPLSPEEMEEINIKQTFSMVKGIIQSNLINNGVEDCVRAYREERGINTNDDIINYNLGYSGDWSKFTETMRDLGIEKEYLESIGVNAALFNRNNLIFTIIDEYGVTRGFAGRNCAYSKEDKTSSKYINSSQNIVYTKSSILYNLNRARKRVVEKHVSLYITEGYTDAIALDKIGLKAVALGGVAFTNEHISLLQKLGIVDIVVVLDGDSAGIKAASKITVLMEGVRNFRVRMIRIPDNMDPEELVRQKGPEAFVELPHISAFEWRLKELSEHTDLDGFELAQKAIPLIVNERSEIERLRMCSTVAQISHITLDVIRKEVALIANNDKIKLQNEQVSIVDNAVKMLKGNPTDAYMILQQSMLAIKDLSDRHNANIYDIKECIADIEAFKLKTESEELKDAIKFKSWPLLEEALNGQMSGKLLLVGGQPNAGKTSFLVNLATNVLSSGYTDGDLSTIVNQDDINDVSIFYHTIDDARYELVPRLLASIGSTVCPGCTINAMSNPNRYVGNNKAKFLEARNWAYSVILKWMKDGKLVIKDASHGRNLSVATQVIDIMKDKHPDRQVIYICDNLHNLADLPNIEDENKRQKEIAGKIKDIATIYQTINFASVEYNKGGDKAQGNRVSLNEMIKQSKSLEYHANFIAHLLNDMHANPNSTEMYHWDDDVPMNYRNATNKSPIINLVAGKNKITGYKRDIFFKFSPEKVVYNEINKDDLQYLSIEAQKKIGTSLGVNTDKQ